MFSIEAPLPPPRRNLEDADEDLLEGLGAETLLREQEPLAPPCLSWKKSISNTGMSDFEICSMRARSACSYMKPSNRLPQSHTR